MHPDEVDAESMGVTMNPRSMRILVDGKCPLCAREGEMLRRLDRGRGRVVIEDIAAPEFDPGRYGLSMEAVMGAIHGIEADGSITRGMEVFRRAYDAVGLGWLLRWTAWWPFRPVTDRFYRWFARNRMFLTGRGKECVDGRCAVTPASRAGSG